MYKFGRLLSAIVSQNISALIVVGIFRALFGVYGWFPDDHLHLIVGPMLNWLVPLLFGYTGGQLLGGKRGGVVAAIVIFGLALASSASMIFVALILGPAIGWLVSRMDRLLENRLPMGFELLVSNFIHAAIAAVLALASFTYIGQTLSSMIKEVNEWLIQIANSGWLPAASFVIETSKVLFLNNVINYGIMGPLGISQIHDLSKSIFFLLESNPGPAIGVIFAYILKSKGKQKKSAKSVLAIHALGGIQEVYFPYVLMRPILLIPLIAGSMAGIGVFQYLDAGLVAISSPPSLLLIAALTPRDDMISVLIGITVSSAVSFALAYCLVKSSPDTASGVMDNREMNVVERLQHIQQWEELKQVPSPIVRARRGMHPANSARRNPNNSEENKQASTDERAAESDSSDPPDKEARGPAIIGMICFACDAGMGSSAMGAAMLKKKMKAAGIGGDVKVVHSALDQIPQEADLIITHQYLLRRAMASLPDREYLTIDSYTSSPIYETLLERLRRQSAERITHDQVFMACEAASRKDAARQAAARLALLGYADESALDRLMGGEGAIIAEPCPGVAFALLTATGGRTGKMRNGTVLLQFPEGVPGEKGPIGLMIGMTCSEETFDSRSLTLAVLRLSEGDIHALRKTRSKQEMIEAFRRANEAMTSDGDKGIR